MHLSRNWSCLRSASVGSRVVSSPNTLTISSWTCFCKNLIGQIFLLVCQINSQKMSPGTAGTARDTRWWSPLPMPSCRGLKEYSLPHWLPSSDIISEWKLSETNPQTWRCPPLPWCPHRLAYSPLVEEGACQWTRSSWMPKVISLSRFGAIFVP